MNLLVEGSRKNQDFLSGQPAQPPPLPMIRENRLLRQQFSSNSRTRGTIGAFMKYGPKVFCDLPC